MSGHGIAAALLMARTVRLVQVLASGERSPGLVRQGLNDALAEGSDSGVFATLYCALLEVGSGRLVLANGVHGAPLLLHTDGITEAENARGLPFGAEGCAHGLESVGGGEAPLPLVLEALLASHERFVNAQPLADDCNLMALLRLDG